MPLQFYELKTNYTKEKYPLTFPPQAGGNRREGEIDCVIANEVKQSRKSKFGLLRRSLIVMTLTGLIKLVSISIPIPISIYKGIIF